MLNKGDIVAANVEGVWYNQNAVAEVLKVNPCGMIIIRIINGSKDSAPKDQVVTAQNFRLIPKV